MEGASCTGRRANNVLSYSKSRRVKDVLHRSLWSDAWYSVQRSSSSGPWLIEGDHYDDRTNAQIGRATPEE
jgi:hypothetical protein